MRQINFKASMLDEEMVSMLQAYGQAGSDSAWGVGRAVIMIREDLDAEGVSYPAMGVYKAVAQYVGVSAETVRMRYQVAKEVPNWLVEKHDWMSFHQWKALVPFAKDTEYEILIEAWQGYCGETGLSDTSVDGLRAWLHRDNGGPSPELVRYNRLVVQARKLKGMQGVPGWVAIALSQFLSILLRGAVAHSQPEWSPEEL